MPSIEGKVLAGQNGHLEPADVSAELKASAQQAGEKWGQVARRLFLLSTNSLATLLVVVAAVAFARQVVSWWKEPAPPPRVLGAISSGAMPPSHGPSAGKANPLWAEPSGESFFGSLPWVWVRQRVAGGCEAAASQLAQLTAHYGRLSSPEALVGEAGSRLAPVPINVLGKEPDLWTKEVIAPGLEIWVLPGAIPISVAVRHVPEQPASKMDAVAEKQAEVLGQAETKRAVAFGIARPIDEHTWQVDLFWYRGAPQSGPMPGGFPQEATASASNEPPPKGSTEDARNSEILGRWALTDWVPPHATVIVALDTPLLGAQVLFRGAGPPPVWMKHFQQKFAEGNWKPTGGWSQIGTALRRRAARSSAGLTTCVEIAIVPTSAGDFYGLVLLEQFHSGASAAGEQADRIQSTEPDP